MPRGRPTTLTPKLAKALVERVRHVFYVGTAAQILGIPAITAAQWVERGEGRHVSRGKTPLYVKFARDIRKAQGEFVQLRIDRIHAAAEGGQILERETRTDKNGNTTTRERYSEGQWTAAAWPLERALPDQWGRREPQQVVPAQEVKFTFVIQRAEAVPAIDVTPTLALPPGNGHGGNGDG